MGPAKKDLAHYLPSMDVRKVALVYAKDGKIAEKSDVINALRVSGLTIYKSQEADIFKELGDGPYAIDDIEKWHAKCGQDYIREKDELEKALSSLISHNLVSGGAGKIDMKGLKHLCGIFGDKIPADEFDTIMKGMEGDVKDGYATVESVIAYLATATVSHGYT